MRPVVGDLSGQRDLRLLVGDADLEAFRELRPEHRRGRFELEQGAERIEQEDRFLHVCDRVSHAWRSPDRQPETRRQLKSFAHFGVHRPCAPTGTLFMSRRERYKRRTRHRGHPVRKVIVMFAVLAICGVALGALAAVGWVVEVAHTAPNLSELKPRNPNPLSEVFASDGTPLGYIHSDQIYVQVAPNLIPLTLKRATVAIEDRRFWQHGALDYQGILRAGVRDIFGNRTSLQGASTLTMQLVDNKYMPSDIASHHNLKYKIIQAKLAEQLEKKQGKSWILDTYLNDVPYGTVGGQTAVGVGGASETFFDKPVWRLDLAQMALLAGLPQAPSEYNPFLAPHLALQRRHDVLDAMVKSRYITQSQANAADREPLQVHTNTAYRLRREPYVFDYIQQQLIQRFGLKTVENGGLKVYSTIDLQKQQQARAAIDSHEGGPVLDDQPAAALTSVDPHTGRILAMASSATYDQTKFDYPVQAHRQPGSAFKIFALMTLIHDYDGDPNQTYYTSRFLAPGWNSADPTWSVHTAEETYQGNININKATVVSDNTVFAQLASDLGYSKLDATAHAMGITSPLDGFPSEVIGGLRVGVTTLEMADAYATIADGGVHHAPTIIDKVVFPDNHVVNLGDLAGQSGVLRRRDSGGDRRDEGCDHPGNRHLSRLRLPGSRQDRNRKQHGQRVVRRLHPAVLDSGLGRLPAGQHPDARRLRRRARGADLARLHAVGVQRVLWRLPGADNLLARHRVLRAVRVDRRLVDDRQLR